MDISKFLLRNKTNFKEINDLDDLINEDDIIGTKYFYPLRDGGDNRIAVLYINGSLLDGEPIHDMLLQQYNKNKKEYKNEWIKDVTNIDLKFNNILTYGIPCARVVLNDTHNIAEILVAAYCNIDQISQQIKDKYHAKVYMFSPNDSILQRSASRLGKKV